MSKNRGLFPDENDENVFMKKKNELGACVIQSENAYHIIN